MSEIKPATDSAMFSIATLRKRYQEIVEHHGEMLRGKPVEYHLLRLAVDIGLSILEEAEVGAYQRGHTDGSNDRLAEFKRAEGR